MRLLLDIGRELLAALIFLVPFFLVWNKAALRDGRKCGIYLLFAAYLAALYNLVGLPNVTYVRFEWNLNLVPFRDMAGDLRSTLLNVVLFLPMGFFLPLCWEEFREGRKTICYGFCVSLLIEALQIFTLRATDVNDLITNTLGTALGFLLAKLLLHRFAPMKQAAKTERRLLLAITFGTMFFLHPFSSLLLWKLCA